MSVCGLGAVSVVSSPVGHLHAGRRKIPGRNELQPAQDASQFVCIVYLVGYKCTQSHNFFSG